MDDRPGSHLVRVCTGLSCRLAGAAAHLRALEERRGLVPGRTTSDGVLTLEETDCLAVCALAPVLEVDGACHGRVTAAAVERLPMWFRTQRPWQVDVEASDFPQAHAAGPTARERLADLRRRAEARARTRPEFRFLVQAGSCGEALGAEGMIKALRLLAAMRGLDAEVLDGACHGMCSAGLMVEVQHAGWPHVTFTHLTSDDVPDLLAAVVDDKPPLTRFEGVAWTGESWRGLPPASRHPFFAGQRRLITERCGHLHPVSLSDALLSGGYSALADVLDRRRPHEVIDELKGSGPEELMAAVAESDDRHVSGGPRYVVAHGEEGAAGLFTDRHLMEGDPQRVLEGLLIAAYAVGANRAIVHINEAARLSLQRMVRAFAKARAAGLIGDQILGSGFSCHVEIRRGACGFVRGQERALLASIEGQQESSAKPSVSRVGRLWGEPVVVTNVATLAAIPPVIAAGRGGGAIQDRGTTRLLGVSGPVNRPGMVEVPRGITLRALLFETAAGLRDPRTLKGVRMVGRADVVLGPESLDGSLESLDDLAAEARGVIAIPDGDSADMSVNKLSGRGRTP